MNRGLNVTAKNIDSGQPAQCAQADLSRYFLLLVNNYSHVQREIFLLIYLLILMEGLLWNYNYNDDLIDSVGTDRLYVF